MAACQPSPTELLAGTLPATVEGHDVSVQVITKEQPLSGVPSDDVLAALGRTRDDSVVVVGQWAGGSITAISIPTVALSAALEATFNAWNAPVVTARTQVVIDGNQVEVLTLRDGASAYVWPSGSAVYVVETSDPAVASAVIADVETQ